MEHCKVIRADNKTYGIEKLKHKLNYCNRRIKPLEKMLDEGSLSIWGALSLGRLRGMQEVYEDLLDEWAVSKDDI